MLLEVPQSVTVVGGETLDRQQATNFQDYLALVPGLSLNGSTAGVTRITLRGVNTGGVASTVAIYMDDVPFGSSTGLANGAILSGDFDPFDISTASKCCAVRRAPCTAQARSAASSDTSPTPPQAEPLRGRGPGWA